MKPSGASIKKYEVLVWGTAIFLIAFGLRLLHVFAITKNSPFFDILPGDLAAYDRWAQQIVREGFLGREIFYQDPLYPYFLAVIYAIIGRNFFWIYVIQSLIGAGTAVLIFLLGERLRARLAGIVGALFFAFYGPAIFFDGLLLKESLAAFLYAACFFFLLAGGIERPRPGHVLGGLALGLACLARANFLLLIPLLCLVLFLNRRADTRQRLLVAGLFFLGNMLVLVPVLARNYVVGGDLVLTTSQAGQNFFIGQNPKANGTYIALPFVRPDPMYEQIDFQKEAQRRLGRSLKPSEVSQYWFSEGLTFIRNNPGAFFRLTWVKLRMFLNDYEIADNLNYYFHQRYSKVLALTPISFGIMGPFFLIGLFFLVRERRLESSLLVFSQIAYILSVIAFYVFDRYRMPVIPVFCLIAGFGIDGVLKMVRKVQVRNLALLALFVLMAMVFVNRPIIAPFDMSHSFVDEAIAYEMKEKLGEAFNSYEEALRINPRYLRALERKADLEFRSKYYSRAKNTYERILIVNPGSGEARARLIFLDQALRGRGEKPGTRGHGEGGMER